MIYLIGGSPRVGKTNLAEGLAGKTSFPYFSLDHVTSVITPYIPEQEYVTKLPLFASRLGRETVDDFYATYSTEQIVNFYLHSAETYWAGVANFIVTDTLVQNYAPSVQDFQLRHTSIA
ncbi:MAG TPA: hypothetical protein VEY11_06895 [Pyrinomonadaceae bacterium]|nr:hypothetical protein [Pyrinomonadaceae bacterium]